MNGLRKLALFLPVIFITALVLVTGCGKVRIGVKEEETTQTRSFEGEAHLEYIDEVWTYIDADGNTDYTFSGVADNEYGSWLVEGGVVNFDYSGPKYFNGRYYIIINGKNIS